MDGTFEDLAIVDGHGNTASGKHYTSEDRAPFDGWNYYKLIQVDRDGTQKDYGIRKYILKQKLDLKLHQIQIQDSSSLRVNLMMRK